MKFCKKCQIETERYANGRCKPCRKVYREVNSYKIKAYHTAYCAANSKKRSICYSIWQKANAEKISARHAAWQKANPEACRIKGQNRRARKRAAGGKLSKGLAEKLFKLQRGLCPCCKQPLGVDFHLDHKMPIYLGGANEDWNMQLLRKTCNLQKNAQHPIDFMQSRGFLL